MRQPRLGADEGEVKLDDHAFTSFVADAEPRLRRALVARYGVQQGREATLEALVYAWRHWEKVRPMQNAIGYLYRVGTSSVRPVREIAIAAESPNDSHEPWVEPALEPSLALLSEQQRVAVVLRHSFEWTYEEIAELLDVSISSVRTQIARGMDKLRDALEVSGDG